LRSGWEVASGEALRRAAAAVDSVATWMQQWYPLRLPVDRVGTVDRLVFQLTLEHFGLSETDVYR
jgi:hypothetical protein